MIWLGRDQDLTRRRVTKQDNRTEVPQRTKGMIDRDLGQRAEERDLEIINNN